MNKNIILSIVVILLLAGGAMYYVNKESGPKKPALKSTNEIIKSQIETAVLNTLIKEKVPDQDGISIVSTTAKDWPDACLGLPQKDEMCAEFLNPGFEVTVKVGSDTRIYRTNADGSVVRRAK
jgi:hypothetical protein